MTRKRTLGPTETRLLNRLAADGHVVFSTAQARDALNGEERHVNKLLHRLTQKRWLLRLEKGKYLLLPLEAGMEGLYGPHEFIIAAHLVEPYAVAYASAFSFYGFSDLLPHTVFVATTRRKAPVTVDELGLRFRFVTLTPHKFFSVHTVIVEEHPVRITTPSKTLVDGLDRPDLCGGIVELVKGVLHYAEDYADWLAGGVPPANRKDVDDIVDRFAQIVSKDRKIEVKTEFVERFGMPHSLTADKVALANQWLDKQLTEMDADSPEDQESPEDAPESVENDSDGPSDPELNIEAQEALQEELIS